MSMIRWKGMGANQLMGKNIRCFTELWMFFLHPMWPPSAWFQPWTEVTKWFWSYQIHWQFSIPTSHHFKEFVCIWSSSTSWSIKSSLKHFSHYCHVFFHSGHLVFAPHITKALLPPNGCPSHKLWWWHCKKPRPAFGRFCWLSYPPLEHFFKYIWLALDFWLAFLGARCIYTYIYITVYPYLKTNIANVKSIYMCSAE